MRLTLRTLLAYLDDTLDASETKLIGQKVAESDAAQELIARIKQVTRRRRLTSPPATGSGTKLDPNLIAEYLDNVLTSEQLAEVEETCLASDTHLAEVAAAHQILTLVLGEPALVPPTAKQRMYGLIRGREAIPNRKATAAPIGQGSRDIASMPDDEADETLLLGLSLSRPGSWLRWTLPVLAICLLVAAGLAIWLAISTGVSPIVQGKTAPADRPTLAAVVQPKEKAEQNTQADKTQPEPPAPEKKKDGEAKKEGDSKQEGANTQTAPEPKPATGAEKGDETPKKATNSEEPKPQSKPPQVQPPRLERREIAKMTLLPNFPAVLLQRASDKTMWQRVKPESRVYSTDQLVSLPGYRCELQTDSGAKLLLWGNMPQLARMPVLESSVVIYQNPEFDLDFKLYRGLVVIGNQKASGPARVRLRFHKEVWDLSLPNKSTEVGVQLIGNCRPYTREPGGGEPTSALALFALNGQADLQIRYRQIALPAPSVFVWDSNFGLDAAPKNLDRPPEWWMSKLPSQNREAQGIESALKTLANRLIAKDAIDVALGEALHDDDPAACVVAVNCLGAVGDWSNLIDTLSDEKRWDMRFLAMVELKYLLGLDAANDQKLLQALRAKNYKDGPAQTVLELLHGYSEDDWADQEIRLAVVEHLRSEKLAVRQLTHALLLNLVPEGRKIPYDPAGDVDLRDRGYLEWRKAVAAFKPPQKQKG